MRAQHVNFQRSQNTRKSMGVGPYNIQPGDVFRIMKDIIWDGQEWLLFERGNPEWDDEHFYGAKIFKGQQIVIKETNLFRPDFDLLAELTLDPDAEFLFTKEYFTNNIGVIFQKL